MIKKNIVKIKFSKNHSLIKNMGVNFEEFKKLINKILIYDKKIEDNTILEWEEINEGFFGIIINKFEEDKEIIYFASKMKNPEKCKTFSRNTYIKQNFWPIFKIAKNKKIKKSISINPLDLNFNSPNTQSIILDLKCLKLIGFEINKSMNFIDENINILNLEKFLILKNDISKQNKQNKPIYLEKKYNEISGKDDILIFAKFDGVNKISTLLLIFTILYMDKNLDLFLIPLNKGKISKRDKNFLPKNVKWFNEDEDKINIKNILSSNETNEIKIQKLSRNQTLFKKNIINFYLKKNINLNKCFACNYNNYENLISAHIHRVADIIKDFEMNKITKKTAEELLVSGENGFLLCPNSDKEFEKGQIIFNLDKFIFEKNKNYYKEMINKENIFLSIDNIKYNFSKNLFSDNVLENVKKHIERIKK